MRKRHRSPALDESAIKALVREYGDACQRAGAYDDKKPHTMAPIKAEVRRTGAAAFDVIERMLTLFASVEASAPGLIAAARHSMARRSHARPSGPAFGQPAFARAAELLRENANSLLMNHTVGGNGDWTGEEDAMAAHDEYLAVAAAISLGDPGLATGYDAGQAGFDYERNIQVTGAQRLLWKPLKTLLTGSTS